MKRFLVAIIACALLFSACSTTNNKPAQATDANGKDITSQAENKPENDEYPSDEKVAAAYLSGDESDLNELEKDMLLLAKEAVASFYQEGMSDEEICIAAHDWIVTHTTYDTKTLAVIPSSTPYSDCAYGVLKSGVGICSGYTGTFKLFMDMLGVENTVVSGQGYGDEHAWNMVCIEQKWYHIDCTWDDFIPDDEQRPAHHIYMFLSDDEMTKTDHQWDKDSSPKADSDDLNYYKSHMLFANNSEEAMTQIKKAVASGADYAEIAVAMPFVDIMYEGVASWITIFPDYYVLALTINR